MKNKTCQYCKTSTHMTKVLDETYGIVSERYRVCFECQPSMDSGDYTDQSRPRALNGDDGDLNYFAESSHAPDIDETLDVELTDLEEVV